MNTESLCREKTRVMPKKSNAFKQYVQDFLSKNKTIIHYYYDETGKPAGVIVAYKKNGELAMGYSKCHSKLDHWNRYLGLKIAIDRAQPVDQIWFLADVLKLPSELDLDWAFTYQRAQRYFKDLNLMGTN